MLNSRYLVARSNIIASGVSSGVDSYEKLAAKLKTLPYRPFAILDAIGRLSSAIPIDSPHASLVNSATTSVLFVAAILATEGDSFREDTAPTLLPVSLLNDLCHDALAISSQDRKLVLLSSEPGDRDQRNAERVCMIARYIGLPALLQTQTGFVGAFSRFAYISGYTGQESMELSSAPELGSLLREHWGLEASELVGTLMTIWYNVIQHKNPYILLSKFVANCKNPERASLGLRRVLSRYSLPLTGAREFLMSQEATTWVGLTKAYYLFRMYPLLQLAEDHYIAGPHQFLSHVISEMLFKQLRSAHTMKHGENARRVASITPAPGERFQAYAFQILSEAMPAAHAHKEASYKSGWRTKGAGIPDGIMIHGGALESVVLQAKLALFPEGLLGGNATGVMNTFRRTYAYSFVQSIRFLAKLDEIYSGRALSSTHSPIFQSLARSQKVLLLTVVPSFLDISFWPTFQEVLFQEIMLQLEPSEMEWLSSQRDRLAFHIDSIETIELYSIRFRHMWLPEAIRHWQHLNANILRERRSGRMPVPFRNFLNDNLDQPRRRYPSIASDPFDIQSVRLEAFLRDEWGLCN